MKLSLVVLTPGPAEGKIIPINVPQFVIGRHPNCHLRPSSLQISKRHCALVRWKEKVSIIDFGSTKGTFVNDQQIKGELELVDGDRLRVGLLTFVVRLERGPGPADQPTPTPATKATTQKQSPATPASPPATESARAVSKEDEAAAALLAMQGGDMKRGAPEGNANAAKGEKTNMPIGAFVSEAAISIEEAADMLNLHEPSVARHPRACCTIATQAASPRLVGRDARAAGVTKRLCG
jgi:pSer/pThr/pTyr-binding forkhead associated (FHA) protein